MEKAREIILASGSPRRAELLKKHGIVFRIEPSDAAEPGSPRAEETAMANAREKAEAVSRKHPAARVLGADTVIEFEGETIGKPCSEKEAAEILERLSGKTHFVTTGVCILCAEAKERVLFAEVTRVVFRKFGRDDISRYLALVNVLDKAGAYALQEHPEIIVDSVEGDPENVIGLPARASEALKNLENQD